jgi:4-amino-4-deoxy-L-arabinose transferase-like glycosyltransferase
VTAPVKGSGWNQFRAVEAGEAAEVLSGGEMISPPLIAIDESPSVGTVEKWLDAKSTIHTIIGIAILLRVAALAAFAKLPLAGDDTLYHDFAIRALRGESIYPLVPPTVGYYLAFFYKIFGVSPLVARSSILLLSIGFLYALHSLATKFAGRKSANLLTLAFAIFPLQILCSVEPITELPASLLLLICLSLTWAIDSRSRVWDFLLLGFALGLLILTRPSTLLLLSVVPPYLAYRSRRWLASALIAAVPVLMITFYIATIYSSTGHFVMINFSSTQNVFLGNNSYTPLYRTWWFSTHTDDPAGIPAGYRAMDAQIARLPWYEQNAVYRRAALQAIVARPELFALRTFNRMRVYFAFDSYSGSLLLNLYHAGRKLAYTTIALDGALYVTLALSAILFISRLDRDSPRFLPALMIAAMILIYAGPYFLSVSHPIYRFPILPLIGLMAAGYWSDLFEGRTALAAMFQSGTTRVAIVFAMAFFAYIQIEYAIIMYVYSSR